MRDAPPNVFPQAINVPSDLSPTPNEAPMAIFLMALGKSGGVIDGVSVIDGVIV